VRSIMLPVRTAGGLALLDLTAKLEEAHGLIKTLQVLLTAVGEEERLAGDQLTDDVGEQYLARLRAVADASGELDRGAEEVRLLLHELAGIKPDPNAERRLGLLVAGGDSPLDGDGAVKGLRRLSRSRP